MKKKNSFRTMTRKRLTMFTCSPYYSYCLVSLFSLFLLLSICSIFAPPRFLPTTMINTPDHFVTSDPDNKTFYDDPKLSYSIEKPTKDWDEKRREWLELNPSLAAGSHDRILMITGSQPNPCENPVGDHLLLRLFKNKVDYCRIHGYDIVYNDVFLHPKMDSFWAKYPVIKAAMLAHPEAEWVWWVDSDAVVTDMEFRVPLRKYENYSLVAHGWPDAIYKYKSWTGLNAGVFLIRNCQWSLDFIKAWAEMGPMGKDYAKWGPIQKSLFKNKLFPQSDDQAALIYLLYKNKGLMGDRVYLENQFLFQGYWTGIVPTYENVTASYDEMERVDPRLRRPHAEKVHGQYWALREAHLEGDGSPKVRRPFVTHFAGCQPCRGGDDRMRQGDDCWNGMIRALNFADNQVLRNYGFVHPDLLDSHTVTKFPIS